MTGSHSPCPDTPADDGRDAVAVQLEQRLIALGEEAEEVRDALRHRRHGEYAEVLDHLKKARDGLLRVLPEVVEVAMELPSWPDTLLTGAVEALSTAVSRLDAAAALIDPAEAI